MLILRCRRLQHNNFEPTNSVLFNCQCSGEASPLQLHKPCTKNSPFPLFVREMTQCCHRLVSVKTKQFTIIKMRGEIENKKEDQKERK